VNSRRVMRLPGGTINSLDFDLFPLHFCSLGAWSYGPAMTRIL
jgi:hypothetical protein